MRSQQDQAKAELLTKAIEAVPAAYQAPGAGGHEYLDLRTREVLVRRYYRHAAPDDLLDREPVDLLGAAVSTYGLGLERPQGTAKVRVHTPTVEENGWTCGHTVVEIVTDDMPFLVDSVTAEISRQGHGIHIVIHPLIVVDRDLTGALLKVHDVSDPARKPQGATVESWMHIEIDRETDREALAEIEQDLRRVLRDVREVVEDWQKMRAAAERIGASLGESELPVDKDEVQDGIELMSWLAAEHFTFIGYREYDLVEQDGEMELKAIPGTGLGVLRSDQTVSLSFSKLSSQVREQAKEKRLLVLTKANSRATVHRPGYLDYIGVKRFDESGEVVGECRFLGLFSASAYNESVLRIPVLRRKVMRVLEDAGVAPGSHDAKDLLQILETYPRDELFQIPVDELEQIAGNVLYLQERRRLRLFLRKEKYGRYYSALVYLPRDRFNTTVRLRMQSILLEELDGTSIDYTARNTESVLSRLHFVVRGEPGTDLNDNPDVEAIERRLVEATRTWNDDFADALLAEFGEENAADLARKYADAFPEGYKADFPPRAAVADLRRIEELRGEGDFAMSLYESVGAAPGERRFKIYRRGDSISLSEVLPVLQEMGLEVVDEHPYDLRCKDGVAWIYDFGLRVDPSVPAVEGVKELFSDAFAATWTGRAENDGFNALVPRAGLTWRQVSLLRAYAKFLRQGGTTFSQEYIESVLVANRNIAKLLVRLFEARLGPAHRQAGRELEDGIVEELTGALDAVASLDDDRILRSFLTVIRATLRTNYFQRGAGGEPKPYISFKIDSQAVPELPLPRPRFEIWVYSPRFEGVHLRFGKVARGGLRWSDRREDFRTEILGLVKAQMVKNAVIVPVGAKGGFVAKSLPDPAVDRDAWLAEGVACYQTFIAGLLDITDNLVNGAVVPPPDVVRHDDDDTYLVVAADKGTATFSDIANSVAAEYGFWLGDAFASGGSAGYDHKAMGITARGAWESVKRHFRELGVDTQNEEFTAVGIGDMSGDVFGNGMLLSEHIRLLAAFDHRHIFLDPNPDAATSYAERRRLFDLPRSSWADYDSQLVSSGGGVYPRSAKSIPIGPQVRAALGLPDGVSRMTPAELMHAILLAPADLLWNGGIGTYVKASTETHADVGDKANDAIRVDGADLRAKVVGEGGNLGLTQLGRIEYARTGGPASTGGKINNDAIDNSAGVGTSDYEVNIKILLGSVVSAGDMTGKQRNTLLHEMTDEVGHLVLRANYGQNVALASAIAQNVPLLHVHARYLRRLVRDGHLDRALEFLPTERQIAERRQAGQGLTQPEFAVLLAYTKITLEEELLASDLPDDPYLRSELYHYFPTPLRELYREQMDAHPLRREIITTQVVNNMVNNAGTTFVFRLKEETGASAEEIARAHQAARVVFDLQYYWNAIEALDNQVPAEVQTRMRLAARRLVERASRWFLNNRRSPLDIAAQVDFFSVGVAEVIEAIPRLVKGADLKALADRRDELTASGVPEPLAVAVAGFPMAFSALDICEVARDAGREVEQVAEVYFDIGDRLEISEFMARITALPRTDRWKSMARQSLRDDVFAAHAGLTFDVLAAGGSDATPTERFEAWSERNAQVVARAQAMLEDIATSDSFDLATLSVAMRVIKTMLRSGSLS